MALHDKNSVRHKLYDEVYASVDLSWCMPKYKFPEPERDPRAIYAAVHDELMLDGNSRQNLATFCLHADRCGGLPGWFAADVAGNC